MAANMSVALVNAGLEALLRFVGDLDFELSDAPVALLAGSIVGACSLFGGLIGGKIGLLAGGGIGWHINNVLMPRIKNVGDMLRELPTDHLRNLFVLLISGIRDTVCTTLGQIVSQSLGLTDLLKRFGSNSDVLMNIIQTLINFFSRIHGGTYRQVTQ